MEGGSTGALLTFDYSEDSALLRRSMAELGLDERGEPLGGAGARSQGNIGELIRAHNGGGCLVSMTAKPNAKVSRVANVSELRRRLAASVHADLAAPPRDGEANKEACALLASALSVPKSSVSIAKGGTSRDKVLLVEGLAPQDAAAKLASLA